MTILQADEWNEFLIQYPKAHILQSSAWGGLKSDFGWQAYYIQSGDAGAQILFRRLPMGLSIAYIPKGPVGSKWSCLWDEVDTICRKQKAIFLKIEPDSNEPLGDELKKEMSDLGTPSEPIQPRRTMVIDLSGNEDDWLNRMKQKTRYNIRLAQRKDIVVRVSNDMDAFHRMMLTTGSRDGFGIHHVNYYRKANELFSPNNNCVLLQAEYQNRPLAALMLFSRGERTWYFYGASTDEERNRMPTYILQWEAMRWSAKQGCDQYDLWGVPDAEEDELEANFTHRSDGLWGVYRFKRGFGAILVRSVGAWDRIYNPALYQLYRLYSQMRTSEAS